jgi:hypothetical protein
MESQDATADMLRVMEELNALRAEIIRRHYGASVIGSQNELQTIIKSWEVLSMGVNILLTKPNTVQSKKNTFLLFANSKFDVFLTSIL